MKARFKLDARLLIQSIRQPVCQFVTFAAVTETDPVRT
jgi:hypothetical protein